MSSTNVYRDTTGTDYLNNQRLTQEQALAGNTANTNYTPEYIITANEPPTITDSILVNGNISSPSDAMTITDSVLQTSQNTGTFVIDTAKIDFSDVN